AYGSSVWRYSCLCLARARMERGEIADGDRLARQSATGTPEDQAHLALLRREPDVADRILTRAPRGLPEDEQFRNVLRAIVLAQKGDPREGVRVLEDAAKEFAAQGMIHWALGVRVHAAYWREARVRGGGAGRAPALLRELGARGGEGFAYYLPEVATWLGRAGERDPMARDLARTIRARADVALTRTESNSARLVAASALDEVTFFLRTLGLTWREIAILREMELLSREGTHLDRAALARRLDASPNTLRANLTRTLAELDVSDRRGDEVLLDAALSQRPVA